MQQDYIERMIAQIAAVIGRVLGRAKSADHETERELAATWSGVLGVQRADLERLDLATLRIFLGEKRLAAAMLLEAEADLKRACGQDQAASRLALLAAQLRE